MTEQGKQLQPGSAEWHPTVETNFETDPQSPNYLKSKNTAQIENIASFENQARKFQRPGEVAANSNEAFAKMAANPDYHPIASQEDDEPVDERALADLKRMDELRKEKLS